MYTIVASEFHGGRIVAETDIPQIALDLAKSNHVHGCTCGGYSIVASSPDEARRLENAIAVQEDFLSRPQWARP